MKDTMTLGSILALFGAMVALSAVPSISVLTVSARSAAAGFRHGAYTVLGIVTGDIVFILLAIFGLVLLVEALGSLFFLIKYVGGAYLIWLGIRLWRTRSQQLAGSGETGLSWQSSFMTGLLITLGDQKAILFYLGFLPAFMDLTALSYADIGLVVLITVATVGGVKLAYAYAADRAGALFGRRVSAAMNVMSAGVMLLVGVFVIISA